MALSRKSRRKILPDALQQNHARKSTHQHPSTIDTNDTPLPFRNLVHGDDTAPQFLVRGHAFGDPRPHVESERGALAWCDAACGDDVCPGVRSEQMGQTKTVFGTPWQLGRFFFVNYADDSGVGDVWMLEKQRLELRGCHCTARISKQCRAIAIAWESTCLGNPIEKRMGLHGTVTDENVCAHLVLDEFFPSVDDRDESLGVANRDIARLEPPIGRDRRRRRTRIVQVSLIMTRRERSARNDQPQIHRPSSRSALGPISRRRLRYR